MTPLGTLRVASAEALPFAREKLRAALVVGGLRAVMAGQVAAAVSQTTRASIPAELTVSLADEGRVIQLGPGTITGRYQRLPLPSAVGAPTEHRMRAILERLTREELLHDLERQVAERTADLEAERERSERLLQNMMPAAIAERMKNGETIADVHEASVLFADIKGFTTLAGERAPNVVVAMLDRIFREFDEIAIRHGVEKIKTIGDSYMAAAGVPVAQADHVDRAVLAALDIVAVLPKLRQDLDIPIDVRVGIHCGPVVAGVIGTRKYAYDIWGDTVNIASRMESHGVAGKVQVSDTMRQALGARYEMEERGTIAIKNRGEIRTWFIHGLAAL